jgi:hypothetical protein
MAQLAVYISLDNAAPAFCPGEVLSGQYTLDDVDPGQVNAVELSVLWYTEGAGDEDMAVHYFDRQETHGGDALELPRRFSTVLPHSPLSYDGVLVKIHWRVRIRVLMHRGKDLIAEEVFRLGSVPQVESVIS